MPEKGDVPTRDALRELSVSFRRNLPMLVELVEDKDSDFNSLRLYSRGGGELLAVCKRYGSDGSQEVCFGSGYGWAAALLTLESGLVSGRWRKDVPYGERKA